MERPYDWITPELAVGGCFHPLAPAALAGEGVGAVIDLRGEACDDAEALAACGLAFLHLPTPDLAAVPQPMLDAGVAFACGALEDGRRVLIHCQHGIGRSALLALCVMTACGWAPQAALTRMKEARERVSPSPAQYEAWACWLNRRAEDQGSAGAAPSFETFAAVAYRHLAPC